MSEVKPMTVQEWIDAGNSIEKLGDTTEFKQLDLLTRNRATFGNSPPKSRSPYRHYTKDVRRKRGIERV